ncbi:MAG: hypothetical protein JHC93_02895 [Parachlamydiales bacterium]|nr:hypothetical protein [Parachlamydiales bacterium]
MRSQSIVFTLTNLCFIVLLIASGVFFFVLPKIPHFTDIAISFLLGKSWILHTTGAGLCTLGMILLATLYRTGRSRYYNIRMGKRQIDVTEVVVQKIIGRYWKKRFPGQEVHTEILIKRNSIHIIAELPAFPYGEQKNILEKIETDLEQILEDTLGYHQEFVLNVSFQAV